MIKKVLILGVEPQSLINFRQDLITEAIASGHEVVVAAMAANAEQLAILAAMGAKFHEAQFSRAGMNPVRDLATVFSLVKLFRTTKPGVIIAYTAKPVIYGSIAARLAGVSQFAAMITGLGYSFIDGPEAKRRVARIIASALYWVALRCASVVIFQNPDDRRTFEDMGLIARKTKVGMVNGSGVDIAHFNVVPLPTKPVFIMVGRLLIDKGIREYAAAAQKIRSAFPQARTLLVGSLDPSPNSVRQSELDQWIADGLEYLGHQSDVRSALGQASVIVLPSYREGTPRSVLEGMAMGRAVITTDAPGCRETIQDGLNGLLVPTRDVGALFFAMKSLLGDTKRVADMGRASRQRAVEKYEGKAVAREILRLAGLTL